MSDHDGDEPRGEWAVPEIHTERRFGELTLPRRVTAGWWFGTPRLAPFFEAEILDATAAAVATSPLR